MGSKRLDCFWLKIIALTGMTFDHIATVFDQQLAFEAKIPMFFVGGFTFPIMAFLLVEGYKKTSDLKKYMFRLFVFALIAQAPFMWAFNTNRFNILFTLLLGLISIYLYDTMENRYLFWIIVFITIFFTNNFDWNLVGVPLILGINAIRHNRKRIIIPITVLTVAMEALLLTTQPINQKSYLNMFFFAGSFCVIPMLLQYSGNRGKNMKFFFYVYYPLHLAVLVTIHYLLNNI